jgi:hypothetical protein
MVRPPPPSGCWMTTPLGRVIDVVEPVVLARWSAGSAGVNACCGCRTHPGPGGAGKGDGGDGARCVCSCGVAAACFLGLPWPPPPPPPPAPPPSPALPRRARPSTEDVEEADDDVAPDFNRGGGGGCCCCCCSCCRIGGGDVEPSRRAAADAASPPPPELRGGVLDRACTAPHCASTGINVYAGVSDDNECHCCCCCCCRCCCWCCCCCRCCSCCCRRSWIEDDAAALSSAAPEDEGEEGGRSARERREPWDWIWPSMYNRICSWNCSCERSSRVVTACISRSHATRSRCRPGLWLAPVVQVVVANGRRETVLAKEDQRPLISSPAHRRPVFVTHFRSKPRPGPPRPRCLHNAAGRDRRPRRLPPPVPLPP